MMRTTQDEHCDIQKQIERCRLFLSAPSDGFYAFVQFRINEHKSQTHLHEFLKGKSEAAPVLN
jgi:hypothetical protein